MQDILCWYVVKQRENSSRLVSYPVGDPLKDPKAHRGHFDNTRTALLPVCKYVPSFLISLILKWKTNKLFIPCTKMEIHSSVKEIESE